MSCTGRIIMGTSTVARGNCGSGEVDSIKGDIEAGLAFAAAAIEYQWENPPRAKACRGDAEGCYGHAFNLLAHGSFSEAELVELTAMLDELLEWIDLSRPSGLSAFAAA